MVTFDCVKNEELGLYEGTLCVTLPPIVVTRYKADRNDFKYEMRRAVSEIVEEIIEKQLNSHTFSNATTSPTFFCRMVSFSK